MTLSVLQIFALATSSSTPCISNPFFADDGSDLRQQQPPCPGSMHASTSSTRMEADGSDEFIEAPAFHYDVDFDLRALKAALKAADFLEDSGYQSVLERSQHARYGTGWLVADNISENGDSDAADDSWDGYMTVGADRVKVKDMSDILASRYAFISGGRTADGCTVVTFPDSRAQLSYDDYHLLITYLLQVPPLEDSSKGFVLVVDRRSDKWSSVRTLFFQLASYFPGIVRLVLLLKPEGVLQRALEVGYRSIAETTNFRVVICESSLELRRYLPADVLTMDVGGLIKYNHLEWVQHRMDIERMKSSAAVIAQSLSEFGRCLRETELPNDVDTTARILEMQSAEKDAIKEDFRISIRKGLSLLRNVRQLETKPEAIQLSPTRLHNVTAIERMLVQLEETERSFDAFWARHEKRLMHCLQLRQFEESFRKLQSAFAKHMMYLEEHREVGDGAEKADALALAHAEYLKEAMEDVDAARTLQSTGEELISSQDVEVAGSLLPKCEELGRMADALKSALDRRTAVLALSKQMHLQIAQANSWCKKGVEILSSVPLDVNSGNVSAHLTKMDQFLAEGQHLQLDTLNQTPTAENLMLLTTTETSTLLAQVAERIDDIRRMGVARRDALHKLRDASRKPVQVVSPEKTLKIASSLAVQRGEDASARSDLQCCAVAAGSDDLASTDGASSSNVAISIENFVIAELVNTERSYVVELESVLRHYVDAFEAAEASLPPGLRGRSDRVFGNIRQLHSFHAGVLLPVLSPPSGLPPSTVEICNLFLAHGNAFLSLYHSYCQNTSTSENLRREFSESTSFFSDCQRRAGHPLPLGAYLLKPVQRITKYQLLLRELERHCSRESRPHVERALKAMLDLLAQINAAIHQLHISGFNGDLRLLGPLRLQTECDVYAFKKKNRRLNKAQRRHLFLFDGGILFCKKRSQPAPYDPEYYEHKLCIPSSSLGFTEVCKSSATRFEIWDEGKSEAFAIEPLDPAAKLRWLERLGRVTAAARDVPRQRPKSWASTVSNDSTCSTSTRSSGDSNEGPLDSNGNTPNGPNCVLASYTPLASPSSAHGLSFTNDDPEALVLKSTSTEELLVDAN